MKGRIYRYIFNAEIKEAEKREKELSEKLLAYQSRMATMEAVTENMREGLILVNRDGIILSANQSALDIFGESRMEEKNILHICRNIDFLQKINECLLGNNAQMNLERTGKTYEVYLNPVYGSSEISGTVILLLDVTEKYKAEKHRREFSANVSHELRTPLTTISALSEMIAGGIASEEDVRSFAVKISGQTKRLMRIVDDIIKLSEFDEGGIGRSDTHFELYSLADSVLTSLKDKADEKSVSLRIYGGHFQIKANERMIDELLYNLVENGIKYNKNGGEVTVSCSIQDEFCIISVSDTGEGIPEKHHDRVFERFYRVDKSRSKKTGGTGLGLSIVKHIVEYYKGRIELFSRENEGTTVTCYIKTTM